MGGRVAKTLSGGHFSQGSSREVGGFGLVEGGKRGVCTRPQSLFLSCSHKANTLDDPKSDLWM